MKTKLGELKALRSELKTLLNPQNDLISRPMSGNRFSLFNEPVEMHGTVNVQEEVSGLVINPEF